MKTPENRITDFFLSYDGHPGYMQWSQDKTEFLLHLPPFIYANDQVLPALEYYATPVDNETIEKLETIKQKNHGTFPRVVWIRNSELIFALWKINETDDFYMKLKRYKRKRYYKLQKVTTALGHPGQDLDVHHTGSINHPHVNQGRRGSAQTRGKMCIQCAPMFT